MSSRRLLTLVPLVSVLLAVWFPGRCLVAAVTAAGTTGSSSALQGPARGRQTLVVVIVETPLLLLPDADREPLRMLEAGTVLRFLDEETDWFHAEFQDFHYGRRVGYVQKKDAVAVEVSAKAVDAPRTSTSRR